MYKIHGHSRRLLAQTTTSWQTTINRTLWQSLLLHRRRLSAQAATQTVTSTTPTEIQHASSMATDVSSSLSNVVQHARQDLHPLDTAVATTSSDNNNNTGTTTSTPKKRDERPTSRDRYRNAARSLPYWLGNDPECFQWTMGALQLQPQKEEYRELYQASLGSFLQKIMEEQTSPIIQQSLETLVQLGFGDLAYAKKFRSMKTYQTDLAALKKKLARKTKSHATLLKQVEHHQTDIAAMEKIANKNDDNNPTGLQHDNDDRNGNNEQGMNVGRVISSVRLQLQSLFTFGSTEQPAKNNNKNEIDDDDNKQEQSLLSSRPSAANRERALQKRRRKLDTAWLI
ncbi:hypothetical protein MHU86_21706 [Fragilaria crotonensis]|nr:hypothetical protein MHU86_21706 [Fragilaria crotonensis]